MRRGSARGGPRLFAGSDRVRSRSPKRDIEDDHPRGRRESSIERNAEALKKKKFTNRCRLFVGNLAPDVKESDLREQFAKFGEVSECSVSSKGVGFVRLDTRANTELAKEKMDGFLLKGRALRIRYALNPAIVRVKELSPYVSNELLYEAFSRIGDVERAIHFSDEKGRPLGEGIVEFARRGQAEDCVQLVNERVFLLTSNPKPVLCEKIEGRDEEDGLPEAVIPRGPAYVREREQGARYARRGTFEYEYAQRWKQLYLDEKIRREQLDREFKEARLQLESEMDIAYQKYKAEQIREELKRRQEELNRLERETQERMDMVNRRYDEERFRTQNFAQPQNQSLFGMQVGIDPGYGVAQMVPPPSSSGQMGIDEQFMRLREGPPDGINAFSGADTFGMFPASGLNREFLSANASAFGGFENGPSAMGFGGGNMAADIRDRGERSPELPWSRGGGLNNRERRRSIDSKRRRRH